MAPPLRGRFQAVVRIAGDLSSPRRRRMAACSAGGLHRAVTRAASSRMRRMLLLRCVAAALASRRRRRSYRSRAALSPHGSRPSLAQRTTPTRLQRLQGCRLHHLVEDALGAVLQPLIEPSVAARALAMNASRQPLRHAAVTAATGRVARLSISSSASWQDGFDRVARLLRSLVALAEEQSCSARPGRLA